MGGRLSIWVLAILTLLCDLLFGRVCYKSILSPYHLLMNIIAQWYLGSPSESHKRGIVPRNNNDSYPHVWYCIGCYAQAQNFTLSPQIVVKAGLAYLGIIRLLQWPKSRLCKHSTQVQILAPRLYLCPGLQVLFQQRGIIIHTTQVSQRWKFI